MSFQNHVPLWLLGFDRTIQPDKYCFQKIVQIISFNWDWGCIVPTLRSHCFTSLFLLSWHKELIWDKHLLAWTHCQCKTWVILFSLNHVKWRLRWKPPSLERNTRLREKLLHVTQWWDYIPCFILLIQSFSCFVMCTVLKKHQIDPKFLSSLILPICWWNHSTVGASERDIHKFKLPQG